MWAEMTKDPCFVYDESGMYLNQTCYFFKSKHSKYLLGLLNSKTIFHYMQQISSNLGEGSLRWIKQYVEKLPIPKITPNNQATTEQIITIVEQILASKDSDPQADTTMLESQIDSLVYTLYNLTDEEIHLLEKEK